MEIKVSVRSSLPQWVQGGRDGALGTQRTWVQEWAPLPSAGALGKPPHRSVPELGPSPPPRRVSVRIRDNVCKVPSTCLGRGGLPVRAGLSPAPRPSSHNLARGLLSLGLRPSPASVPLTPLLSASPNPPSTQASLPDSTPAASTPHHPPNPAEIPPWPHAGFCLALGGVGCIRERWCVWVACIYSLA